MVIYIRVADPALIKAIDKYAERKHLSRSAFLLQALENMYQYKIFLVWNPGTKCFWKNV